MKSLTIVQTQSNDINLVHNLALCVPGFTVLFLISNFFFFFCIFSVESTELPNCLKSEEEKKMLIITDEQFNKKKNQWLLQRFINDMLFFLFYDDLHQKKGRKKRIVSFSTDFLYISNEKSYFKSIYLKLNFKSPVKIFIFKFVLEIIDLLWP